MNEFVHFASRFHKLKADLQEMEEVEYARLSRVETDLKEAWQHIGTLKKQSQATQSHVTNRRDWHEFEQYHSRLESEQFTLEHRWNTARRERDEQQSKLHAAYVEQEKWSSVAQDAMTQWQAEQVRQSQTDADADAVARYRKVDSLWQRE